MSHFQSVIEIQQEFLQGKKRIFTFFPDIAGKYSARGFGIIAHRVLTNISSAAAAEAAPALVDQIVAVSHYHVPLVAIAYSAFRSSLLAPATPPPHCRRHATPHMPLCSRQQPTVAECLLLPKIAERSSQSPVFRFWLSTVFSAVEHEEFIPTVVGLSFSD